MRGLAQALREVCSPSTTSHKRSSPKVALGADASPGLPRVLVSAADAVTRSSIVEELLAGETLAERLHREHRVRATEALAIASQSAEGRQAAHDGGITCPPALSRGPNSVSYLVISSVSATSRGKRDLHAVAIVRRCAAGDIPRWPEEYR